MSTPRHPKAHALLTRAGYEPDPSGGYVFTDRYNGSDEMTPAPVLAVCSNPTCNRRSSYYGATPQGSPHGKDPETGRNLFAQPAGRGRKALYCSVACRVDAHKTRKDERDARELAEYRRVQAEEHARRLAARALARERRVQNVVNLALEQTIGERPNSRPTTTTMKHAAEHITRMLMLADLIKYKAD